MKRLALSLLCLLLAACATQPPAGPPAFTFFHDALFAAPDERIGADDVFALNDAMRQYLKTDIARELRADEKQTGLIHALYSRGQLRLEYDATMTRNAAQAFDARSGNCLSLVLMTAAFAKQLGLSVTYQSVAMDETWSRKDNIAFANGHVNITLGAHFVNSFPSNPKLTVDFLPGEDLLGQRTRPISEDTVVAMFMNNRSAEALVHGRTDDAYWWARAAIVRAPEFMTAFNTLGVVYLRHGDLRSAEQAFNHVLDSDPKDRMALANMATLLERDNRPGESEAFRVRLAKVEPYAPYHFFRLGIAAMRHGDFADAKMLFKKEVDRADYNGEFHFWLGLAELQLGEFDAARGQMQTALQNSTTRDDHDLYAAKLDRLRAVHAQ